MTYYIEYIEGTAARITDQPPYDSRFHKTANVNINEVAQVLNKFHDWLNSTWKEPHYVGKNIERSYKDKAQHLLSLCL